MGSMGGFGGGGGGGAPQAAAEEAAPVVEVPKEKTHYDVELTEFDAATKVKLIKEVRGLLGLGLKEAKECVVETAEAFVATNPNAVEAETRKRTRLIEIV